MRYKPLPPVQTVRDLLNYDPLTGVFTWKYRKSRTAPAGGTAGTVVGGRYTYIWINGQAYKANRLAWLYMTGEDPLEAEIDHISTESLNDSFANLRKATRQTNNANVRRRKDNTSGIKGVSIQNYSWGVRYKTQWCEGGKRKGKNFPFTPEGLEEARLFIEAKRRELYNEYARDK